MKALLTVTHILGPHSDNLVYPETLLKNESLLDGFDSLAYTEALLKD